MSLGIYHTQLLTRCYLPWTINAILIVVLSWKMTIWRHLTIHGSITRMSWHILNSIVLNLGLTWPKCIATFFAYFTFSNHENGSKFTILIIIEYLKLIGVFLVVSFNHLLVIDLIVCFLLLSVFTFVKVDSISIDLSSWNWIKRIKFIIVLMPSFIIMFSTWIYNLLRHYAMASFRGHSLLSFWRFTTFGYVTSLAKFRTVKECVLLVEIMFLRITRLNFKNIASYCNIIIFSFALVLWCFSALWTRIMNILLTFELTDSGCLLYLKLVTYWLLLGYLTLWNASLWDVGRINRYTRISSSSLLIAL